MNFFRPAVLLIPLSLILSSFYGSRIISRHKAITIHKGNYTFFLDQFKPDSAIIIFKRDKVWDTPDDTGTFKKLFELSSKYVISKRSFSEFITGQDLNLRFIKEVLAKNEAKGFRLFFRDGQNRVYKYQDVSLNEFVSREVVITDRTSSSIEVQKFFESGEVASRTQYTVAKKFETWYDSVWYDLNPKLIKSGKEEVYYENRQLRLSRIFANGKLYDTSYTEYYPDGKVQKRYKTVNGLADGVFITYNRNEEILQNLLYEKGQLVKVNSKGLPYDGHKKAFLFGLDKYAPPPGQQPTVKNHWNDLAGCVNDINILKDALKDHQGFNPKNIVELVNENATRQNTVAWLKQFPATLKKGDIVFVHFSGHGNIIIDQPDSLQKYEGLYIPCRDANYPSDPALSASNFIFQYELAEFFNRIKREIGKTGQLVISIDVSHAGELMSYAKEDSIKGSTSVSTVRRRGETDNMLFNIVSDDDASVIIYSASSSSEDGIEIMDNGKVFGAYSWCLAQCLFTPFTFSSSELFEAVADSMKIKSPRQTPGYLATQTQFVFESNLDDVKNKGLGTLPAIKSRGKAFVLSVGISKYPENKNSKLSFANCESDARAYAGYFKTQFGALTDSLSKNNFSETVLLNEQATKDNIIAAVNRVISFSKPEDYYVFNFSGYCKPLKDSSGKQVTYFVPSGLEDINDSIQIIKKGISLSQLKELFQMIPANNQLFITEAGTTEDFQKEFIQALIETSPTIASLSNKNRVFIVPRGSGLDRFGCKRKTIDHGPINYAVTNLPRELNVFGLFEGGVYADAIRFALNKTEVDCDYFRTSYSEIFFERDFIKSLHYFLPEDVMKSRGGKTIAREQALVARAIKRKYALVIGTNNYQGKPDWSDLDGVPTLDAIDIGKELKDNYGFDVSILLDKPADSIYERILRLSRTLDSSDQVLIYVAGHGDYDERLFDDGFIVCSNSKPVKEDPYRNSYIQYSKLSRMVNKLPAKQIMMVLDVCFGGTFDERVAKNRSRSKDDYENLSNETYLINKLKLNTRLYLTSGGKREVPNGYKGSHSPFAQQFLQCLYTKGGQGKMVTSTDFFQYVKKLPSGPLLGSFGDDEINSEFIIMSR
jgi:hypothetical protein